MEIKDSGSRREFSTGAVRDRQDGKGRCDLIPLEVASKLRVVGTDYILEYISEFQKHQTTNYLYDALTCFCSMVYDTSIETMLLEVAKHFEAGAKKYGENNWQKGLPPSCYVDSAVRHYLKFRRGDNDEPHDRAFVWNLICCIWEVDYHKKEETT